MNNLIESIDPSVTIYEFTVFPNISTEEVDEQYLSDETVLFSDDIENLVCIIDSWEAFTPVTKNCMRQLRYKLSCSLLGLWCMKQDNKWDLADCSLSKCLKDTDQKLKQALVTRKSVDEAKENESKRKKKGKEKKYPYNPEMVKAPDLFKDYLKISCLTKDQLDIFNSTERFLWVDGPAGCGKTLAMLGKIVQLALATPQQERILLITGSLYNINKSTVDFLNKEIREDIKCEEINLNNTDMLNDMLNDGLAEERIQLILEQLLKRPNKIILLHNNDNTKAFKSSKFNEFIKRFDYIFIDDCHDFLDDVLKDHHNEKDFITEGLLPILKMSETNSTSIWVVCDKAQAFTLNYAESGHVGHKLRDCFTNSKELYINLRNTYEISSVLAILRKHYEKVDIAGPRVVKWQQQENGHYLRGTKLTVYLVRSDKRSDANIIRDKELDILVRGSDSCLEKEDVAMTIFGTPDENNTACPRGNAFGTYAYMSSDSSDHPKTAEWTAVITIIKYNVIKIKENSSGKESEVSMILNELYKAISRARVYSTVIIYSYCPNVCEGDNQLLEELKHRTDVCRIIEINDCSSTTVVEPTVVEPTVVEPTVVEPIVVEPIVVQPTVVDSLKIIAVLVVIISFLLNCVM